MLAVTYVAQVFLEEFPVLQIANAQVDTICLTSVAWTNTLLGGTNSFLTEGYFLETVNNLMELEQDVCSVGDEQSTSSWHVNSLQLNEEMFKITDNT